MKRAELASWSWRSGNAGVDPVAPLDAEERLAFLDVACQVITVASGGQYTLTAGPELSSCGTPR